MFPPWSYWCRSHQSCTHSLQWERCSDIWDLDAQFCFRVCTLIRSKFGWTTRGSDLPCITYGCLLEGNTELPLGSYPWLKIATLSVLHNDADVFILVEEALTVGDDVLVTQWLHNFDFPENILLLLSTLFVSDDLYRQTKYFDDVELAVYLGLCFEGCTEVPLAHLLQHPVGVMRLLLILLILPSRVVASLLHNDNY